MKSCFVDSIFNLCWVKFEIGLNSYSKENILSPSEQNSFVAYNIFLTLPLWGTYNIITSDNWISNFCSIFFWITLINKLFNVMLKYSTFISFSLFKFVFIILLFVFFSSIVPS